MVFSSRGRPTDFAARGGLFLHNKATLARMQALCTILLQILLQVFRKSSQKISQHSRLHLVEQRAKFRFRFARGLAADRVGSLKIHTLP
jgi:hypothetical protein